MLIANECLDNQIRSKEYRLLCKLDLANAYDHVNWDFLALFAAALGFGGEMEGLDTILYFYSEILYGTADGWMEADVFFERWSADSS
jgi:hypothetical protein